MKKKTLVSVWNTRSFQFVVLVFVAICLSVFHIGNDMFSWSRNAVQGGELLQIGRFVLMFLHTIVSILLFLLLVVRSRVVAYAVLPFVIITWSVPAYLRVTMGHCLYSELVTGALETNWHELSAFLTPLTVVVIVLMLVGCFGLGIFCRCCLGKVQQLPGRMVWGISLLYLGGTMGLTALLAEKKPEYLIPLLYKVYPCDSDAARKNQLDAQLTGMQNEYRPEYPYRVLLPFYRQVAFVYYVVDHYVVKDFAKAESLKSTLLCDDDVVVVLFIGESYRAGNASWNGYERETLPKLSTLNTSIINFPYFKSYATSTISSIYGILSDATCRNRTAVHTSMFSIMEKHGFELDLLLCRTTRWDLNPKIFKLLDGKVSDIHRCGDSSELVAKVENIVKQGGRRAILIEDGTGHAPYAHDPEFAKFGSGGENYDLYDNCLLQVDDLLFRIIEKLRDRKAVVVYSSDHGQSFGEQNAWMHGGALNIVQQRHVFSFVWFSDQYAAAHSDKIENMRNNAAKQLSHDDIYLSVLSLGGIECELPTPDCGDFTKPLERPDVNVFSIDENL